MDFPVLVEPIDGGRFRAKAGSPFDLTAEGATSQEAIDRIREQMYKMTAKGAWIVRVPILAQDEKPIPLPGDMKGDPFFDEWKEAMAEYRRQVDAEESA